MSSDNLPCFYKADYDFDGDPSGGQLSFKKGDTFLVKVINEGGWFTAERNRETGYIPSNYVSKIEAENKKLIPPIKKHVTNTLESTINNNIKSPTTSPISPQSRRMLHSKNNSATGYINKISAYKPVLPHTTPTLFKPNQSAAPPIPLRTDLGEETKQEKNDDKDDKNNIQDNINTKLLCSYNLFYKYQKRGKPQKRLFFIDNEFTKISWKDPDKDKIDGYIMLNDVISTKKGHYTKKNIKNANLAISMSIICYDDSKTLELDASTANLRNEWLVNFDLLLASLKS